MPNQVGTSQVIRFATFEVDLQTQELRKGGLRLKLSGQPFQVLAILLEQPGVVVTREELQNLRRRRSQSEYRNQQDPRGTGRFVGKSALRRDAAAAGISIHRSHHS